MSSQDRIPNNPKHTQHVVCWVCLDFFDPVVTINEEIKKMFTDKYIGAIHARYEGLIQDLDAIDPDSYDDWAVQTRLDDLSRLYADIKMNRNADRAVVVIDQRINWIKECDQTDEKLERQRIADLIYLQDVLTGQDPQ